MTIEGGSVIKKITNRNSISPTMSTQTRRRREAVEFVQERLDVSREDAIRALGKTGRASQLGIEETDS